MVEIVCLEVVGLFVDGVCEVWVVVYELCFFEIYLMFVDEFDLFFVWCWCLMVLVLG